MVKWYGGWWSPCQNAQESRMLIRPKNKVWMSAYFSREQPGTLFAIPVTGMNRRFCRLPVGYQSTCREQLFSQFPVHVHVLTDDCMFCQQKISTTMLTSYEVELWRNNLDKCEFSSLNRNRNPSPPSASHACISGEPRARHKLQSRAEPVIEDWYPCLRLTDWHSKPQYHA